LIDRLINWLIDRLVDRLIDGPIDKLIDRLRVGEKEIAGGTPQGPILRLLDNNHSASFVVGRSVFTSEKRIVFQKRAMLLVAL
jgi:hypothetical protein